MNRLILLYWLILLGVNSKAEVWEFGNNLRDSVILGRYKGEGPLLERIQRVEFYLPSCYYTFYVRAEVINPATKPRVSFNWEDNSITFRYAAEKGGDSESISKYNVILKGKYQKKCKRSSKLDQVKIRPDIVKPLYY